MKDTIIIADIDEISKILVDIITKLIPPINNETTNKTRFITKSELAEHLNCSESTIDNRRNDGKINAYTFGRKVLFDLEEVLNDIKDSKD